MRRTGHVLNGGWQQNIYISHSSVHVTVSVTFFSSMWNVHILISTLSFHYFYWELRPLFSLFSLVLVFCCCFFNRGDTVLLYKAMCLFHYAPHTFRHCLNIMLTDFMISLCCCRRVKSTCFIFPSFSSDYSVFVGFYRVPLHYHTGWKRRQGLLIPKT